MNGRIRPRRVAASVVYYAITGVVTLLFITPFLYVVYTSLRETSDVLKNGFFAPITKVVFHNYKTAFIDGRISVAMLNSLLITLPALVLTIALSGLAAFPLARMRFAGRQAMFMFVMICMYIPVAVKLIPIYQLYSALGLNNSIAGIVVLQAVMCAPFCIFGLRNFFMTIPRELQESAIIDGCSFFGIFARIYIPLSAPSVAVMVILQFTSIWNSFIWELLLMTRTVPIMVSIITLEGEYGINWSVQCAGAIIASIPTLLIFLLFQRYFISGLTAGAVKG